MNDQINILLIVTVISLFISLFLSFFLVTVKTEHKTCNYLFAAFLSITAADVSGPLFEAVSDGPSNLGMLRVTLAFLQIPLFYLYTLSVCYSDFKLRLMHLLHLLPFAIANLVLVPRFYSVGLASKIDLIMSRQSAMELQFTHILFHLQTVSYLVAVFMLLRKAKRLYLENNAGASINSYNWLFQFTRVLSVLYGIVLFKNIFKFSDYQNVSEWMKISILVAALFSICWYLYKALTHPDLFRNVDSRLRLVSDIVLEERNSEPAAADERGYDAALSRLKHYMAGEKPYLNPSLTIQEVSSAIEIPVRELSLLINHKLGQHFYDFVNTYRIEKAMEILRDAARNKVTVLEILYEVGFNSKSSFNTAFKKHTGNTPTSYRRLL